MIGKKTLETEPIPAAKVKEILEEFSEKHELSYEQNLTVKLGLTRKLISNLRNWYPDSLLIGFKLLENVPKEHLIEVARKLCEKNRMDFIIANDLHDLRNGEHLSFLVNSE